MHTNGRVCCDTNPVNGREVQATGSNVRGEQHSRLLLQLSTAHRHTHNASVSSRWLGEPIATATTSRTKVMYTKLRFLGFCLPWSAITDTPGRTRRMTSNTKRACLHDDRNTMVLALRCDFTKE